MPRVAPVLEIKVKQRETNEPTKGSHIAKVAHARSLSLLQLAGALFNWCLWLFIMLLMLLQLLTAIRKSVSGKAFVLYGRDVTQGLYNIPGSNDEPYSDRLVACVRRGKNFKAVSLNDAMDSGSTIVEDSSGAAIHGYRVVHRTGLVLSEPSKRQWTQTCRLVNKTLDGMFQACEDLGYGNLTRDSLRIMDGSTLKNIPNALPFLIMPYWDNGIAARSAIPAWDGHACVFRLHGQYQDPTMTTKYLAGVSRAVREAQTIEWLGRPGGLWKNGWYEDTQGMRWYSDILAMETGNTSGLFPRYFDPSAKQELVCLINSACSTTIMPFTWTAELATIEFLTTQTSIAISNGSRFGLFYYRATGVNVVTCVYDYASILSNMSVMFLLCRWMVAMLVLHRGHSKGVSSWHSAGVGSIAHAHSFTYLPIAMMPRMKMILAAFFTVGCAFEGPQKGLADAWFVMYPSIVDFVLIYASLLNMVARLLRRRMNDWVFPFTILTLTCMHYFRQYISSSTLLELGGRMSTKVDSGEFEQLTSVDMLTADVALRMGGNASVLLWAKLLVLSVSILSLLSSESMRLNSTRSRAHKWSDAEITLKIRACNVGGIGRFSAYNGGHKGKSILSSYELVRLGYIVLGDCYLVSIDDWLILSSTKHLKLVYSLWNHRIMAFQVTEKYSKGGSGKVFQLSSNGQLMSIHDPLLNSLAWWDVDVRPLM